MVSPQELVQRIHDQPTRLVMAVTGGGSCAIAQLLTIAGASRTVLEAIVPYSAAAMRDWLGAEPEQYCSEPTARAMAMVAYQRATRLAAAESPAIENDVAGIGCTASLASDRPKRGAHRVHAAAQTAGMTVSATVELDKGRRARAAEEDLASRMILNVVTDAAGLAERLDLSLAGGEAVERRRIDAPPAWRALMLGEIEATCDRHPDAPRPSPPSAVFPGAFHPLHEGHRRMAQVATQTLGCPVVCELSIENVDKPPLDYIEMRDRGDQFAADEPLWFTRAARFVDKARLFAGATFVVGADTIRRIADPRYYADDAQQRDQAVAAIVAAGCRFLVFGRASDGAFQTLADLSLPEPLVRISTQVPESAFRQDISSTELRRRGTS